MIGMCVFVCVLDGFSFGFGWEIRVWLLFLGPGDLKRQLPILREDLMRLKSL
jgi:hypothetical protein